MSSFKCARAHAHTHLENLPLVLRCHRRRIEYDLPPPEGLPDLILQAKMNVEMRLVETAQTCLQKAALGPIENMFHISGESQLFSC